MCTRLPASRSVERIEMYAASAISRDFVSTTKIDDHHKAVILSLNQSTPSKQTKFFKQNHATS